MLDAWFGTLVVSGAVVQRVIGGKWKNLAKVKLVGENFNVNKVQVTPHSVSETVGDTVIEAYNGACGIVATKKITVVRPKLVYRGPSPLHNPPAIWEKPSQTRAPGFRIGLRWYVIDQFGDPLVGPEMRESVTQLSSSGFSEISLGPGQGPLDGNGSLPDVYAATGGDNSVRTFEQTFTIGNWQATVGTTWMQPNDNREGSSVSPITHGHAFGASSAPFE